MVIIKGAGDIATGIAFRLFKSGFKVIMTDTSHPTSIRRTVCFSQAIINGETTVEYITAKFAKNTSEALKILEEGFIPVLSDETAECVKILKPDVLVDAILAKKNLGTKRKIFGI